MAIAYRIKHKTQHGKWVRPEIGYESWKKINMYAKANGLDFPSAVEKAAELLTAARCNECTDAEIR